MGRRHFGSTASSPRGLLIGALLAVAMAAASGCYFIVDTTGIVGTQGATDGGNSDRGLDAAEDAPGAIVDDDGGVLAAWSFDEATDGGIVRDLTGHGHDGQLGTSATLLPGRNGQALASPMSVKSLHGERFPSRGTLSFWLRGNFAGSDDDGLDIFDGHDYSRPHLFVRVPNDIGHVELQMACQRPEVAPYSFVATVLDPPSNVWMHLVFVWDSVLQNAAVYLDGNLLSAQALSKSWTPSGQQFVFARAFGGGLVDDARLYTRALTATEIAALP
jgi:hypothetical protein